MLRRKYRVIRPSKSERSKLTQFYNELYSNKDIKVPTKTKLPAKKAKDESVMTYTDKEGNVQTLPDVKSYEDTQYFTENDKLFPQLEQATFAQTNELVYDEDGRPNLCGRNIIVREVIQMTKGDFGPYYTMHVIADGLGEFSVLTRGTVVNDAIEQLSGVSLETGKRFGPGELPVLLHVEYLPGAGSFEGYYTLVQPRQTVTAEPVEA